MTHNNNVCLYGRLFCLFCSNFLNSAFCPFPNTLNVSWPTWTNRLNPNKFIHTFLGRARRRENLFRTPPCSSGPHFVPGSQPPDLRPSICRFPLQLRSEIGRRPPRKGTPCSLWNEEKYSFFVLDKILIECFDNVFRYCLESVLNVCEI